LCALTDSAAVALHDSSCVYSIATQLGKFRTALEIDCCAGAAVLTLPVSGQCSRTEQRKKLVAGAPL
jgi:hypothetical protein